MKRELKLGQQYQMWNGEIMTITGFDTKGNPYCSSDCGDTDFITTVKGIPFSARVLLSKKCLNE